MSFNHWPCWKAGAALLIAGLAFAVGGSIASAQVLARSWRLSAGRFFLPAGPPGPARGRAKSAPPRATNSNNPPGCSAWPARRCSAPLPRRLTRSSSPVKPSAPQKAFSASAASQTQPPAKGFEKFEEKGIDAPPPKRGEKPVPEKGFDPKEKEVSFQDKKEFGDRFQDKKEFGEPFGRGADWKAEWAEEMPSAAVKVITTSKPYDRDKVAAALLRGEKLERTINGKKYLVSSKSYPWAVQFVNDRTYVIASPPAYMEKLLQGPAR